MALLAVNGIAVPQGDKSNKLSLTIPGGIKSSCKNIEQTSPEVVLPLTVLHQSYHTIHAVVHGVQQSKPHTNVK